MIEQKERAKTRLDFATYIEYVIVLNIFEQLSIKTLKPKEEKNYARYFDLKLPFCVSYNQRPIFFAGKKNKKRNVRGFKGKELKSFPYQE